MSAPLPFVGQKRMFAREFIKVLGQFPDSTVFVDLFGGSGLLSHITKCVRPDAVVVYNDFDNYRQRLANIPATNVLLSDLRRIAEGEPRNKRITGEVRDKMFARIEREEKEHGYVDYITVSASLLFAMKYVTSLEGMKKEAIYNRIRQTDYPEAKDYLEGLTITGEDYKEVFKRYKDAPGVVFLVDPPYLSTEVGTYKMFWRPGRLSGCTDRSERAFVRVLHFEQVLHFRTVRLDGPKPICRQPIQGMQESGV